MTKFTFDQIMQILGGNEGAAEMLDISVFTVRHWPKNGIPARHWMEITKKTALTYEDLEPFHPKFYKEDRCA